MRLHQQSATSPIPCLTCCKMVMSPEKISIVLRRRTILLILKITELLGRKPNPDEVRWILSAVLNERARLSPEMALRIEKAFGVSMDTLVRMQNSCGIAKARMRAGEIEVALFERTAPDNEPRTALIAEN